MERESHELYVIKWEHQEMDKSCNDLIFKLTYSNIDVPYLLKRKMSGTQRKSGDSTTRSRPSKSDASQRSSSSYHCCQEKSNHNITSKFYGCGQFSERHLVNELLKNYNHDARPVLDATKPIIVNMSLAIREIININEKDQVITTSVWIRLYWYDEYLRWNETEHGGVSHIYLPAKEHWVPDIVLFNNAAEKFGATYDDVVTPISSTGFVKYMYPAVFKTSCAPRVRYFPFDEQHCRFSFVSWAYDGHSLDLSLREYDPADTDSYIMNMEWILVNMTADRHVDYYGCCPEPYPSVDFIVTIRRRETPYVFYLVYPNIIINILTLAQFLLPCDSGERVTLGITTVLSLVVFLLLMAEVLPMSETTPLIANYFAVTIFMVGLSLVLTFIVLHIHHNGLHDNETELPQWARQVFLHTLASTIGMRRRVTPDAEHEIKMRPYTSDLRLVQPSCATGLNQPPMDSHEHLHVGDRFTPDPFLASKSRASFLIRDVSTMNLDSSNKETFFMYRILKHLEDIKERFSNEDIEREVKCEWQQVAMVIDRLLFYIYLVFTCLMLMAVFLGRPQYSGPVIK